MTAAVIFLWAGCLWSIAQSALRLIWAVSPWRRLLVLTALALAASCAHKPRSKSSPKQKITNKPLAFLPVVVVK